MARAASVIALFMRKRKKLPGKSSPENATGSRARKANARAADDTSWAWHLLDGMIFQGGFL